MDEEEDFFSLHEILQIVMGWENAHLFEFKFNNRRIGLIPDEEELWDIDDTVEDSELLTLKDLEIKEGDEIIYIYDFGDSWMHRLQVEKITEEAVDIPVCLGGARNCPPEDAGGIPGYIHLVEVLRDPKHPEHSEMLEWVGDDYDPEYFDLEEVNEILQEFDEWRSSLLDDEEE